MGGHDAEPDGTASSMRRATPLAAWQARVSEWNAWSVAHAPGSEVSWAWQRARTAESSAWVEESAPYQKAEESAPYWKYPFGQFRRTLDATQNPNAP
jgi:hypothetical protein